MRITSAPDVDAGSINMVPAPFLWIPKTISFGATKETVFENVSPILAVQKVTLAERYGRRAGP